MTGLQNDRPSIGAMLLIIVLVGGLVGLLYVGPSSWSWRGFVAPVTAGVFFVGSFLGLDMLVTRAIGKVDNRLDWLLRTMLGAVSGTAGGAAWYLVLGGEGFLIPCLVGAGLGGIFALFEA